MSQTASVAGGTGHGDNNRGKGGNKDGLGQGGDGHHSGASGIGGKGGAGKENAAWVGLDIVWEGGRGGNTTDNHGGASGGGSGGGGAGKKEDNLGNFGAGGGAGGSWARQATADNSQGGFLGQAELLPTNDQNGVVVLTFQTLATQ